MEQKEKRGEETNILKRGRAKLGQGVGAIKDGGEGGTRNPLQTMNICMHLCIDTKYSS